jgi:hypothetical protein
VTTHLQLINYYYYYYWAVVCNIEELTALYCSPKFVRARRMRWAGRVAQEGGSRGVYRFLVVTPEGKRPVGRPRRRWEDIIKINL